MLAVQNERDRISSRRNIPDSQDLPPITILAQAETLSKQVKLDPLQPLTFSAVWRRTLITKSTMPFIEL